MSGLIEEVITDWCGTNATAYAVYWAESCAAWIFQGLMCDYKHAVEYVRLLSQYS